MGDEKNVKKQNWFVSHKIWTVVIALLILGIIGSTAGGNNNNSSTSKTNSTSTSTPTASKSPASSGATVELPKINQQANDGKLGFTITSFRCGVSEISQPDDPSYTTSTGAPYCLMDLSVKGISNVSQDFDSSSQYIYDSTGKQYSVDSDATINANNTDNNCMVLPTVNPGVTLTCTLAFDVPASANISYAMLHDSSASNGVKVSLVQ